MLVSIVLDKLSLLTAWLIGESLLCFWASNYFSGDSYYYSQKNNYTHKKQPLL